MLLLLLLDMIEDRAVTGVCDAPGSPVRVAVSYDVERRTGANPVGVDTTDYFTLKMTQ